MHLLFEEDGSFRTGSILLDQDSSLQVELTSGKRSKVKSAAVLLRFDKPAPSGLLDEAARLATEMEAGFLWECASDGEFSFLDFAADYYGSAPSAPQAAAVLLALNGSPVHFHRKGKGRFRRAPPDILQAALASLEKKRQQAALIERWSEALASFTLPPEIAAVADMLLVAPDRNRPETKAFEAAAARTGLSAAALLMRCGAIRSAHAVHLRRFLHEQFPRGYAFPDLSVPEITGDLPLAEVQAFSIDDAATTEIDDALSVTWLPGVGSRIGIHIAAPGLAIVHGSPLDGVARGRLSTVYMPGTKITMLPDAVVSAYTLAAARVCPALSLYLTVNTAFEVVAHESRIERVRIAANLRHHDIEPLFNADTLTSGTLPEFPWRDELVHLWQFAGACEGRRGKPSATQGVHDYHFEISGDLADAEACRVHISERRRGSPLDKLVAELMIVANATWGGLLAERRIPCLYRAQTQGKVRMTTSPLPHEGLGVPQYAWMTSPLRRYCDLVNQWQLIACLNNTPPPFAPKSAELFAVMRDFEVTYGAYADFQRRLERYWSLRWLQQESMQQITATCRREQTVKLDHLPLLLRVPSLPPDVLPGQRVLLAIEAIDLLAPEVSCRHLETLSEISPPDDLTDAEEAEGDGENALAADRQTADGEALPSAPEEGAVRA